MAAVAVDLVVTDARDTAAVVDQQGDLTLLVDENGKLVCFVASSWELLFPQQRFESDLLPDGAALWSNYAGPNVTRTTAGSKNRPSLYTSG